MLPVSFDWKYAIKQQFRYPGHLKVAMYVVPPNAEATPVDISRYMYSQSDYRFLSQPPKFTPNVWATLETNRWRLDGSSDIVPDRSSVILDDVWFNLRADSSLVLTFEFGDVVSFPDIYAEWDTYGGNYPQSVQVVGYNSEGTAVKSYTSTVSSSKGLLGTPIQDVKKVVLTLSNFKKNNWRIRAYRIVFGEVLEYTSEGSGKILSAEMFSSFSPLNNELPLETFSVSLRNLDKEFDPMFESGVSGYFRPRQRVEILWGFDIDADTTEWAPAINMYLESFSIPQDSKSVTINAVSRWSLLTNEDVGESVYTGEVRDLFSIAASLGDIPQDSIPVELKQIKTNAPLPNVARNVLWQYIAGASCCWLGSDPTTGQLTIKPAGTKGEATSVHFTQELADPAIEILEKVHSVSIGIYTYSQEPDSDNISSKVEYFPTYIDDTIESGIDIVVENPLITGVIRADFLLKITDLILDWYRKRRKYTVPYTGYPEVFARDKVVLTTTYGKVSDGTVLSNRVTFNGGFNGEMEVQ